MWHFSTLCLYIIFSATSVFDINTVQMHKSTTDAIKLHVLHVFSQHSRLWQFACLIFHFFIY